MDTHSATQGYFGIGTEWSEKVKAHASDYLVALQNSGCLIEYWAPREVDTQEPHDQDEVYVITAGTADFDMNGQLRSVVSGDLIFVPAGMPHRFVRFSPDLAMWIVFFGPRLATAPAR
nr:cupin domain-containing protein [uncultured Albidiferax sp.]